MTSENNLARFTTWATTDDEGHAAYITQTLLEQGRNATYWETGELLAAGYPIRTAFRYVVLVEGCHAWLEIDEDEGYCKRPAGHVGIHTLYEIPS